MADGASRFDFGPTRWSLVHQGKQSGTPGDRARNELLERYHGAVNRFLLARLGDPNAVDEVYELYVDRIRENHPFLQRADQEKGRFRHYLRRVLHNLVIDYHRSRQRKANQQILVNSEDDVFVAPPLTDEEDEQFRREWVTELMHHCWKSLESASREKKKPFFDVMLYKAENPGARSREIAERFSKIWNKPTSEDNIRQILHRGAFFFFVGESIE